MNAKQLVKLVNDPQTWIDSDIDVELEDMLHAIANHFLTCESCRNDFDAWDCQSTTLQDLALFHLDGADISDWVCDVRKSAQGPKTY